jgi:hypothetical protein
LVSFNPPEIIQVGHFLLENGAIQEHDGIQGARLRTCRYFPLTRQVIQIRLNFGLSRILGMLLAVKENVLANPENVGLLGSRTEMLLAAGDSDLLQQAGFSGSALLTP